MPITTYKDYLDFLKENGLEGVTEHKQIKPATAEYICSLFGQIGFESILEIGRSRGHSFGLMRFLLPDAFIVSVDPKPHPVAYRVALLDAFDDHFLLFNSLGWADLLDHEPKFDFVLVDGDHSYAGVKRDWDTIQPYLQDRAVILFDNVNIKGVARLFGEIDGHEKFLPCDYPQFVECGYSAPFGVVLWYEGSSDEEV